MLLPTVSSQEWQNFTAKACPVLGFVSLCLCVIGLEDPHIIKILRDCIYNCKMNQTDLNVCCYDVNLGNLDGKFGKFEGN